MIKVIKCLFICVCCLYLTGCTLFTLAAVKLGAFSCYTHVQEVSWKEVNVGCLVFENNIPEKRIISITDRETLDMLRANFKIESVDPCFYGMVICNNRMEIILDNGEVWAMCFTRLPCNTKHIDLQRQNSYIYTIDIEKEFYGKLKTCLETQTKRKIEFDLRNNSDGKYMFRDIDFGKDDFCALAFNGPSAPWKTLPNGFFCESPLTTTYLQQFLSEAKSNDIDISKIVLVYSTTCIQSTSGELGIEMIRKPFTQTKIFQLVNFAIDNKLKLILKEGKASIQIKECTNVKDLEAIIKMQLMRGGIAVIFTPTVDKTSSTKNE